MSSPRSASSSFKDLNQRKQRAVASISAVGCVRTNFDGEPGSSESLSSYLVSVPKKLKQYALAPVIDGGQTLVTCQNMELTSIKSRFINNGRRGKVKTSATFVTHHLICAEERTTSGRSTWNTTNKKNPPRPIGAITCYWSRLQVINRWKRVYTVSRCLCLFPRRAWLGLSNEGKNIVNQTDTEIKEPEETPTQAY